MKIVLDITKLVEDGELTQAEAERLKKLAARDTGSLAINILLSIGVIAIAAGIFALEPSEESVIAIGVVLAGLGLVIRHYREQQWGLLGSANILVGALAVSGGLLLLTEGHIAAFLFVAFVLLALGVVTKSGLLVGLSPFALAGALGSSTGYWHASYLLIVREATITILVFALAAAIAFQLSKRLSSQYERLALVFSRVSLVFVNLGFWVGSLWGNYPGESWLRSSMYQSSTSFFEYQRELQESPWFISADVFAALWAVGLLALGAWGAMRNRRVAVNTAAVFGSIHFYTQWFERLGTTPETLIAAGVIAVAIAVGLWKYNRVSAAKAIT